MLIIISGPTASGKTDIAEMISKRSCAEIISADSGTRYRELRIGTGRYTLSEDLPYHMVGDLALSEYSSSFEWVAKARRIVDEISSRDAHAVICGGSFHLIDRFLHGLEPGPPPDRELRCELRGLEEKEGHGTLHRMLSGLDPPSASSVHPNNTNRIIRYIEKAMLPEGVENVPPFEGIYHHFCILRNRDELSRRIWDRTMEMISMGWINEVMSLLEKDFPDSSPGFSSIGYRHIISHIRDSLTIEETVSSIVKDTVDLSRKQIRWCRSSGGEIIDIDENTDVELLSSRMCKVVYDEE